MKDIRRQATEIEIPVYIENIISCAWCKAFFGSDFVREDDSRTWIYTHTEGYEPISSLEKMELTDILNILVLTAENVDRAMNHYIFPGDYVISENTVYVNKKKNQVKFLFHPEKFKVHGRGMEGLSHFFQQHGDESAVPYIRRATRLLDSGGKKAVLDVQTLKRRAARWGVGQDPVGRFMRSR